MTLVFFALPIQSSDAVPNCSQVNPGFCLNPDPANCTVSLEWQGSCANGDRQWRCVWSGQECIDAGPSGWIDCTCTGQGCDCLLAGTMIMMADGTEKPIETVLVGDLVMGFSRLDCASVVGRVERVHAPYLVERYILLNGHIGMTENHPVLLQDEWVGAGRLRLGDRVLTSTGGDLEIMAIDKIERAAKVYNIQVSSHTYIADGVVVHNKDDCEQYMQAP